MVSTLYLYAEEVLADWRGMLVPFADGATIAAATLRCQLDAGLRAETERRAYEYVKPMFRPNVGRRYLNFFGRVVARCNSFQGVRTLSGRFSATSD